MSRCNAAHNRLFDDTVCYMERFDIDRAVEIGEKCGIFDDYDEEKAITRDKKNIIRGRLSNIKDADGNRIFRSVDDGSSEKPQFYNIPITLNIDAITYLINEEDTSIAEHTKTRRFLSRRGKEIEGQLKLDGFDE